MVGANAKPVLARMVYLVAGRYGPDERFVAHDVRLALELAAQFLAPYCNFAVGRRRSLIARRDPYPATRNRAKHGISDQSLFHAEVFHVAAVTLLTIKSVAIRTRNSSASPAPST